jgi:ATP-dependent DNA helicase MPH1
MSSSDYGFDDELDSAILNELDIIEAAHRSPLRNPPKPPPGPPVAKAPQPLDEEDSFFDLSLEIDDAELQRLDTFIDAVYKGNAQPVAGPSNHVRPPSKNTVQRTLFGDVAQPNASSSRQSPTKRTSLQRTKSSPRKPFGQQAPQTKQWDHTVFAKSGWKKPKNVKGKGRDDGDDDDENVEFEQFPAPFVSGMSRVFWFVTTYGIVLMRAFSWVSVFLEHFRTFLTLHKSFVVSSDLCVFCHGMHPIC